MHLQKWVWGYEAYKSDILDHNPALVVAHAGDRQWFRQKALAEQGSIRWPKQLTQVACSEEMGCFPLINGKWQRRDGGKQRKGCSSLSDSASIQSRNLPDSHFHFQLQWFGWGHRKNVSESLSSFSALWKYVYLAAAAPKEGSHQCLAISVPPVLDAPVSISFHQSPKKFTYFGSSRC